MAAPSGSAQRTATRPRSFVGQPAGSIVPRASPRGGGTPLALRANGVGVWLSDRLLCAVGGRFSCACVEHDVLSLKRLAMASHKATSLRSESSALVVH
jgi:hypothetical protein